MWVSEQTKNKDPLKTNLRNAVKPITCSHPRIRNILNSFTKALNMSHHRTMAAYSRDKHKAIERLLELISFKLAKWAYEMNSENCTLLQTLNKDLHAILDTFC